MLFFSPLSPFFQHGLSFQSTLLVASALLSQPLLFFQTLPLFPSTPCLRTLFLFTSVPILLAYSSTCPFSTWSPTSDPWLPPGPPPILSERISIADWQLFMDRERTPSRMDRECSVLSSQLLILSGSLVHFHITWRSYVIPFSDLQSYHGRKAALFLPKINPDRSDSTGTLLRIIN